MIGNDEISLYFQNSQQTFEQKVALPLGYAAIYNSANLPQEANADWYTNEITNLFEFKAIRDIKAGEELTANYNLYTYPKTGIGIQML